MNAHKDKSGNIPRELNRISIEGHAIDALSYVKYEIHEIIRGFTPRQSVRTDMFVALANDVIAEIENILGAGQNITYTSISTRNIFELHLIILHVNSDPENERRWLGQGTTDHKDVVNGFSELFKASKKEVSELQESLAALNEEFEKTDLIAGSGFNIKNLAIKYNLLPDYLAIYKLCSKLAHPTSYKVNMKNAISDSCNFNAVLRHAAGHFSYLILENLRKTFKSQQGCVIHETSNNG